MTQKRVVIGIAYPANRVDGHGDYMSPDVVEETAWGFLESGRQIGLHHVNGTLGHATVVESYIHRGPSYIETAPDGTEVRINKGDWVLAARFDEATYAEVQAGRFTGWSIDGTGRARPAPRPAEPGSTE